MVALFEQEHRFSFPWPAQVFAVLNKYPNPLAPHVVSVDVVDRRMLDDGTIRSERLIGVQQDSPKWINKIIGQPDTTFVREVSFVVPSGEPNPQESSSTTVAHLEPPKLVMASTNLTLANLMQCRESISYLPHPWPNLPRTTASQFAPSLRSSSHILDSRRGSRTPSLSSSTSSSLLVSDSDSTASSSLPPSTLFSQSALIFSTGPLASQPYPPIGISAASPIEPLTFPRANTMPQRALGKRIEQWGATRFETNAQTGKEAMTHAAKTFWEQEWRNVLDQVV
ncbi:hypothetical protein OIV83_002489 [Microbotryomycetes sp. JL201]|nr:hypothetical protein OIV83_002489 [Microbotryomycetes sp. JL201]